jgi:hypothetical protein
MWSSPLVVLMLVLATLYASLFHVLFGRSLRGLLVTWLAAAVGMVAGQLVSQAFGSRGPMVGDLHVLTASVGAWVAMLLARTLRL